MKTSINTTVLCTLILAMIGFTSLGQLSNKEMDKVAIKSMAGCYNVEFKYTETFAPEVDYEKAYDYTSAAFEWAEIIEESDNKISLQHLLIIGEDKIIKHWRQDWIYEDTIQWRFYKDNIWKRDFLSKEKVKGKWTQKVYQVDDSPRYAGTATWVHVDGTSSWKNKADSPLPRREYSKREDYNVMKRGNLVYLTQDGWVHEQDNDKILRTKDDVDILLVSEKGYNIYTKRPKNECAIATEWWQNNQQVWTTVRDVWEEIFTNTQEIKLQEKVEDKRLYDYLSTDFADNKSEKIAEIIDQFIIK